MDRSSTHPWILALGLAACSHGSDSGLHVQSISVPDFGSWECNRPVEFDFDQRIDFSSVSARSIHIRTSIGVPAAGTFSAKPIDSDGDGSPEGTDESVVVFYPNCPFADDLSDAGLQPGARYLVTIAGEDSGQDPDALLRSRAGSALARTIVRAFETIADPGSTHFDEKPDAPAPLVRASGARSGSGCHLELGGDPSNRVFFEAGPVIGRTPGGFTAPLNLLGDPATRVAFVVVFDQPIRPTPANLARLGLEYSSTLGASGWTTLETRAELVSVCRPADPAVRLVPLGTFPSGGFVRARIEAGFEDLVGQATSAPVDEFAIAEVATVEFTSLDPAGAIADEVHEEFDFDAGSPLSLAEAPRPLESAPAQWGEGELRAGGAAALPPELRDFDWVVPGGRLVVFDTTSTDIEGGPFGSPTTVQTARDGLVQVRDFVVESGGVLVVRGPNPMIVHASGTVSIRGVIDASGAHAPPPVGTNPAVGGRGNAGGGDGGAGSIGPGTRGGDGSSAYVAGAGGQGGESGFAPLRLSIATIRGGGGGGGRFARDQGMLVAENGGDGANTSRGAESGLQPPRGGAAGPEVFVDGDPSNDFFGTMPVVDAMGAVVARRAGELRRIHAGSGGGNGGDSIDSDVFPPVIPSLVEGGGGGGGGGALAIRANHIRFGPFGQIRVNGGSGGDTGGTSGGSGSGGHVILEAATAINFQERTSSALPVAVLAIGGPRVNERSFGGAGGPGVVQLHVPHPERAPGDPSSNLILSSVLLGTPDPLAALCNPRPHVLYPLFGARSSARSRWIPLGAAGEGGAAGPESVVALLFDGIETAPGDHEGKVRTSNGRVVELAPLVGPVNLAQPGVELLPDGLGLALSGSVLVPLRARAEPISPDVYLRTPALLEGFTLRLETRSDLEVGEFTVARARYDDAASRLTLTLGGHFVTLAEAVQLFGADALELTLIPRFFRVRQGATGFDLLPDSSSVRILFQGAADDGSGRADEASPLVDWTADVTRFGALPPGALDFVRFQVEFDLDTEANGFDPDDPPLALEFLRLPMRF